MEQAMDRWPADMPPPRPAEIREEYVYKAYGCGYFGCVVPTEDEGVVLKITTDPHEAVVAALLLHWEEEANSVASGIVQYHHAAFLPPLEGDRRRVLRVGQLRTIPALRRVSDPTEEFIYFLWRNEAFAIGGVQGSDLAYLRLEDARKAARALLPLTVRERSAALNYVLDIHDAVFEAEGEYAAEDRLVEDGVPGADSLVEYRWNLNAITEERKPLRWIAQAMLDLLDYGLVLGDVHGENIGVDVSQTPIITDPGVGILMTTAWDDVRIRRL
jgi:hypothetical protein